MPEREYISPFTHMYFNRITLLRYISLIGDRKSIPFRFRTFKKWIKKLYRNTIKPWVRRGIRQHMKKIAVIITLGLAIVASIGTVTDHQRFVIPTEQAECLVTATFSGLV